MPTRKKVRAPTFNSRPQSRFANANGVRLHYLVAGEGNPVEFLNR